MTDRYSPGAISDAERVHELTAYIAKADARIEQLEAELAALRKRLRRKK